MTTLTSARGAALLGAVLTGAALHVGGAVAPAVPVWSGLALLTLALVGTDRRAALRDLGLLALLTIVVVSAVQLIPLPPSLLQALDPNSAALSRDALS
ncbi:MAG: hypothetical protein WCJ30_24830, partial [Deltaproteobacteria bacterium]